MKSARRGTFLFKHSEGLWRVGPLLRHHRRGCPTLRGVRRVGNTGLDTGQNGAGIRAHEAEDATAGNIRSAAIEVPAVEKRKEPALSAVVVAQAAFGKGGP